MKPISELGYEEARDELVEVVRQLEQGGLVATRKVDFEISFGLEGRNWNTFHLC